MSSSFLLANQPPPDFFHDPFWQFIISIAVAVLAIIVSVAVAIWVLRSTKQTKLSSKNLQKH